MAPEVLRGEAYSVNADIWSIGVILYEMLYGHCPFQSHSIASLISTIDDSLPAFDPSIPVTSDVKKFISRCLQKDCRMRIAWE
jgi:serine/threonine-protein kinase ULK/ATG1